MRSTRWQSMVGTLERAALLPPLRAAVAPASDARRAVTSALRKSWRRLERRVADAEKGTTSWHEVRKAAKSTRYAAELLEPVVGAEANDLASAAEEIQTRLGEMQDAVVAREWIQQHASAPLADRALLELRLRFDGDDNRAPPRWNRLWKQATRAAARVV
jgi:CHAD domain-containing protein